MKNLAKRLVSGVLAAVMAFSVQGIAVQAADVNSMTAQQIVADMGVGWNLGNALDCTGGGSDPVAAEKNWGNPVTTKAMIDAVKAMGFNTVRIPTTWYEKCTNGRINSNWMSRVQEVVDYCYANDMYVILNMHHEEDIVPNEANKQSSINYLKNMWQQIATHFKDYDRHLIFEAMNEPRLIGTSEEWTTGSLETRKIISQFNQAAVETIRATGGNNATRLIMCPSNAAKIPASTGFTLPDDDNIVLSVHNYSPYSFAMDGGGTTSWGSDSDKSALDTELKDLYNRFVSKGVPVVIGEMGATNKNNTSAREVWATYFINQAASYGIPCVVWDNNAVNVGAENFGLLNRSTCGWYYPTVAQALVKGLENVKPYTPPQTAENETIIYDGSATAEAWGQSVVLDTMPYLANGYYIAISYSASNPPLLCLQNTSTGEWNQINPDSASGGVAIYSYETIKNTCKTDYSNQNQLLVMSNGVTTTVTRVSVFASENGGNSDDDDSGSTGGNTGNTGNIPGNTTVLYNNSTSLSAWGNFVLDSVPEISDGDYIAIAYSANTEPYLVLQRYTTGEWNQMKPDYTENGIAYYSYNTILDSCTSDYSLQEEMLVMAGEGGATITQVALVRAETTTRLAGDVDLDNDVDKVDAALLLKHLYGNVAITNSQALENADCDGKNGINQLDVIYILNNKSV